jgi:hypothetical protein
MTRLDKLLLARPPETAIKALVEFGSLIRTGASSGIGFARVNTPPNIKRQQKTAQSFESRKRRQASDISKIIFSPEPLTQIEKSKQFGRSFGRDKKITLIYNFFTGKRQ